MEVLQQLMNCDALVMASMEIEAVEVDVIERYAAKLEPMQKEETALGIIEQDFLKRLYCASRLATLRQNEKKTLIQYGALSLDAEKAANEELIQCDHLASLMEMLFWYQIRRNLGCWNACCIGLRADWTIVTRPHDHGTDAPSFIKRLFGQ